MCGVSLSRASGRQSWSGGSITAYGAQAFMTQELCDEFVANESVSESGQKITGPYYDGTDGSNCANNCEEEHLMRPSGAWPTSARTQMYCGELKADGSWCVRHIWSQKEFKSWIPFR